MPHIALGNDEPGILSLFAYRPEMRVTVPSVEYELVDIAPDEIERLVRAVRRVLRAAIRHNGTSFSDFMDSDGMPGDNQKYLKVFQREGENCRRCRSPIQRMRQGNRSSFYCSNCQR